MVDGSGQKKMFRHKRRMELVELLGRITGRLGYDYRLRHRRDGKAGTTILYHLRTYRRPHSSSGMTAGRRELLGMGTAAASAGAAGPSEGLRAGWSSVSHQRSGPNEGPIQTCCYEFFLQKVSLKL